MGTSRSVRTRGRRLLGSILLSLYVGIPTVLFAQEDIDDLFTDPSTGVLEDTDEAMDIEAITTDEKPRLSGSVTVDGGFSLSVSEWGSAGEPLLAPAAIDFSPVYSLETLLRLDVRPTAYVRLYGSFGVSSPYVDLTVVPGENPGDPYETVSRTVIGFSPVFVEELFVDYTLAERVYFRAGKQAMTWGQGRLFNPGNFVASAIDGISVKGFVPLGANGLTAVAIGEGVLGPVATDYDSMYDLIALAGLFETRLAALALGMSAYYRREPGLKTGAYLKVPIAGADAALEGVLNWEPDLTGMQSAKVLTSLFWEGGRHRWQILLEYLFDTSVPAYRGHTLGLGAAVRRWLPGGWKPGLRWLHSFADNSGQVVLGFDGPLAPNLRLALGFPLRYGTPDAYLWDVVEDSLPDDGSLERLEERKLLGEPAAAAVVLLSLTLKF